MIVVGFYALILSIIAAATPFSTDRTEEFDKLVRPKPVYYAPDESLLQDVPQVRRRSNAIRQDSGCEVPCNAIFCCKAGFTCESNGKCIGCSAGSYRCGDGCCDNTQACDAQNNKCIG